MRPAIPVRRMEAIIQQQNLARRCIDTLKDLNIVATLCGGAPRDWHLGKKVADLDLYASLDARNCSYNTIERLIKEALISEVGLKATDNTSSYDAFCETLQLNSKITITVRNFKYRKQKIQLMFGTKPFKKEEIISKFSCSICEYYWDETTGDIYTSELNKKHLANKSVLVNLGSKDSYHVNKLKVKFPEYSFNAFPYHTPNRVSKFVKIN